MNAYGTSLTSPAPRCALALAALLLLPWPAHAAPNDTVGSDQKISQTIGGFTGVLSRSSFSISLADLGDLDGPGGSVEAIAVGAARDDDGGENRGAVWILFLNADGTVASHQKISDTAGGFTGVLDDSDVFGWRVANLGDLDGPGGSVRALAVGAIHDDDGGVQQGAVWVLFLNADGTVASHQKISDTAGGFTGVLDDEDLFGHSVVGLGDLDGTGGSARALAVGATGDDDGGANRGAVWVLFLNADGTVQSHQKISGTQGGFTGVTDHIGESLANLGDLDGAGGSVRALAAGTPYDGDGGADRGAVWVLFLNADGTVASHQKISDTAGGFTGVLDDVDKFGGSVANLGDLDGPGGTPRALAVGAGGDDDGGDYRGAVWVLFLNANGTVASHQKISGTQGGFDGVLDDVDLFGGSVADLGDLDGAGGSAKALAVGATGDDDGGESLGAVWVLFLNEWTDCETVYHAGNPVTIPGYGQPYDVFVPGDLLLNATCANTTARIEVGKGDPLQYIWHTAYEVRDGQWQPFEITGDDLLGGLWWRGDASADRPWTTTEQAQTNYVIAYVCTWTGTEFKCGCQDAACTQSFWQLQAFRRPATP